MTKPEVIRFLILRTIGNFLVLFAIFGVIATFGPAIYYELLYRLIQIKGIEYQLPEPEKTTPLGELIKKQPGYQVSGGSGFAAILAGPKEQILIPKDTEFAIVVPKLGANAKIFPNIDSTNQKEFLPVLQKGVAHAKGSVFPGQNGNVYLFAHSTDNFWDAGRYNAVFYLLKDLAVGDRIVVFFENIRHNYAVTETKIVEASDVSYLAQSQNRGEQALILQTCWPPGTTWKRLIVIAKPM